MMYVVWVKFKKGERWLVLDRFTTLDAAWSCASRSKYIYEFIHVDKEAA
jgi:hypothetical protein